MKIELENLDGHNKKLSIEVPADAVSSELDIYYKDVQRQVTLKGFRKGKAPMDLVKQMYSDNALSRVTQNLVEKHLRDALKQHSLSPVSMPQVNIESLKENLPFKFTATFEAMPPIELKKYSGFKVDKPALKVESKEVDNTLENIQSQMAEAVPTLVGSEAKKNSLVTLDYEATEAGAPVPEATDKNSVLELGVGSLHEDFEKNIIGMKEGDSKSFSVKFPMPEKPEEKTPVSGRTIDFQVKLTSLKSKKVPELNDDLAKKVGPFESLAVLKQRIEEDILKQKESAQKRELLEKIIDILIEENPVDAPQTLVNSQMEQLAIDAGMQLSQAGLDQKAIEERLHGWGEEISKRATRQIKISMLLSAIASKENIQAGEEDIRQEITRIAVQSRRNPKDVLEDLQKKNLVSGLIRQITELKALDWVYEKVTA